MRIGIFFQIEILLLFFLVIENRTIRALRSTEGNRPLAFPLGILPIQATTFKYINILIGSIARRNLEIYGKVKPTNLGSSNKTLEKTVHRHFGLKVILDMQCLQSLGNGNKDTLGRRLDTEVYAGCHAVPLGNGKFKAEHAITVLAVLTPLPILDTHLHLAIPRTSHFVLVSLGLIRNATECITDAGINLLVRSFRDKLVKVNVGLAIKVDTDGIKLG